MDLLAEVRRRTSDLRAHDRLDGIKAATRHIEAAERHLERGRTDADPDAFNDVIYRSNQAFEGMLKEAYAAIHTGADAMKLSPNEIEQYFSKSEKLSERVSTLFKNYRQQWRNPSTHDHTILSSEQEAILAIASVSAFSLVLINQIVEQVNFKRQRQETERRRDELRRGWLTIAELPFADQVVALFKWFRHEMSDKGEPITSEAELVGRFSGFLAGLNVGIDIQADARVGDSYRADILLRRENEAVIIEMKRRGRTNSELLLKSAIAQLSQYLNAANVSAGIIYLWSPEDAAGLDEQQIDLDAQKRIWVLDGE